jgi:hypothetical protein
MLGLHIAAWGGLKVKDNFIETMSDLRDEVNTLQKSEIKLSEADFNRINRMFVSNLNRTNFECLLDMIKANEFTQYQRDLIYDALLAKDNWPGKHAQALKKAAMEAELGKKPK